MFLYALRREVLRNPVPRDVDVLHHAFLYALRREVLRNTSPRISVTRYATSFYTPFGVRCFGTAGSLQPWRQGTFKISQDPRFEDKVRDIVGLYLDPPEGEAVVSVDAKSGIQALDRTQPLLADRLRQDPEAHL